MALRFSAFNVDLMAINGEKKGTLKKSYIVLDLIFTDRKRSLGQGNVFTGVCPQGVWLPRMHHRSHDWGVCMHGWWVCIQRQGLHGTRKAGGTNPTGMLPC